MSQFTLEEWLSLIADLKTSQTEFNAGTASPIFHVQEEKKVYGLSSEYSDKRCWVDGEEGVEFDTAQDYFDSLDAGDKHEINSVAIQSYSELFTDLNDWQKEEVIKDYIDGNNLPLKVTWYQVEWFDVGVFVTRQEADWFIKRKQHDYGPLRIYVKSLYWAPQHKRLIQAILDGEIKYVVKGVCHD